MFIRSMPFLFILSWASGFPITRLGLEYTGPFTLLWVRSVSYTHLTLPTILLV